MLSRHNRPSILLNFEDGGFQRRGTSCSNSPTEKLDTFHVMPLSYSFDFGKFSHLFRQEFDITDDELRHRFREWIPFRLIGGLTKEQADKVQRICDEVGMQVIICNEYVV